MVPGWAGTFLVEFCLAESHMEREKAGPVCRAIFDISNFKTSSKIILMCVCICIHTQILTQILKSFSSDFLLLLHSWLGYGNDFNPL